MTRTANKTMDSLSTLAGVFFFGLCAYQIYRTHFVLAVICLVCAAGFPFIVKASRRAHDELFIRRSTGDDESGMDRH